MGRAQIPADLGRQLAIAYLFATKISSKNRHWWQLVMLITISVGLFFSTLYAQAETWWNKGWGTQSLQMASTINQVARPLIVSQGRLANESEENTLTYLLAPKFRFLLVRNSNLSQLEIPEEYSIIFSLLFKSIETKT